MEKPAEESLNLIRPFESYNSQYVDQLSLLGKIPFTCCKADNRFSYTLYIPRTYSTLGSVPLIILVHHSERDATELRNEFVGFAEEHCCAILAPLFPQGVIDLNDNDNYKFIRYRGIRFDKILISMINDVRERYNKVEQDSFLIYGFSGGAQFTHRFCLLYPRLIRGAVIGAPGNVTLLDQEVDFPQGVRDIGNIFGVELETTEIAQIKMLFLIGEDDIDIEYLFARGRLLPGTVPAGSVIPNRQVKLKALEESFRLAGVNTSMEFVPGVAHMARPLTPSVQQYFAGFFVSKSSTVS